MLNSSLRVVVLLGLSVGLAACSDGAPPPEPRPAPPAPAPPPPPPPQAVCGDSACNGEENCDTCPNDCGECGSICGDGFCDPGEGCADCPIDCGICAPEDAQLVVNNVSGVEVYYLYVSPCSSPVWGPDQLGSFTLPSGNTFTLSGIEPGCYDFRAEDFGAFFYWETYGVFFGSGEVFTWTLNP